MTNNVTQARYGRTKFGKPSLFKVTKCTSNVTNLVGFNRETRRRLHISFFT